MKLHQQVDELKNLVADIDEEITLFRCSILRKCQSPYGDGTYSTMVNADTDVLPRLERLRDSIVRFECRTGVELPPRLQD